jgi:hypothetical protein
MFLKWQTGTSFVSDAPGEWWHVQDLFSKSIGWVYETFVYCKIFAVWCISIFECGTWFQRM